MAKKPATATKPAAPADIPAANREVTRTDNFPPYRVPGAEEIQHHFEALNKALFETTASLLATARLLKPEGVKEIADDDGFTKVTTHVATLAKHMKALEGARVQAKADWLTGERAIDALFNSYYERARKGHDVLHAMAHAFNLRRLAEEKRQREEAARIAREAAEKAERERLAQEQAAREAELAAARARKPENVEAHQERAEEHREAAEEARVDVIMAHDRLIEANIQAGAKAADIVRTRHETGVLSTMREKLHVEITDINQLDLNQLRPYLKEEDILKALRKLVAIKGKEFRTPGALIEMRPDTEIRG